MGIRILHLLLNNINLRPATLAVLIQLVACVLVSLFIQDIHPAWLYSANFPVFGIWFWFALAQATLALIMAFITNMANWWRWIHFIFPLSLWLMSQWQIPNVIYLVSFLISLSLYWTTFRTQVPFFPSSKTVWQQVLALIPDDKSMHIIDIGSGFGGMSLHVARQRPNCLVEGAEVAPLPWLISFLRTKLSGSSAKFKFGDYHQLDFSNYDLVFAYLSPAAMSDLWKKAKLEMRSGALLMSYEFGIEGVESSKTIECGDKNNILYVWNIE